MKNNFFKNVDRIISEEINLFTESHNNNELSAYYEGNNLIIQKNGETIKEIDMNDSPYDIAHTILTSLGVNMSYEDPYNNDYQVNWQIANYLQKNYGFSPKDIHIEPNSQVSNKYNTYNGYVISINNTDCGELWNNGNYYGYVGYIKISGICVETYDNNDEKEAINDLMEKLYQGNFSDDMIKNKEY